MLGDNIFLSMTSLTNGYGGRVRPCGESSQHLRKFRLGTHNVSTLKWMVCEVVEIQFHKKIVMYCAQKTRYHGGNCSTIKGKDSSYKPYLSGNNTVAVIVV